MSPAAASASPLQTDQTRDSDLVLDVSEGEQVLMRLKSEIWVKAYLRRCRANDAPAFVTRRGQCDGGAIFIIINRLNGSFDLYVPAPAGLETPGGRMWTVLKSKNAMTDQEAQAYVQRQREFDPDIWAIEVEDPLGRHFLEDEFSSE